jgi:antitoxin CcdA
MHGKLDSQTVSKRRPVNLTIRQDVLDQAKALNLNASQAGEAGIMTAVKRAKEEQWRQDARSAIEAYNERIDKSGPLLTPHWATD